MTNSIDDPIPARPGRPGRARAGSVQRSGTPLDFCRRWPSFIHGLAFLLSAERQLRVARARRSADATDPDSRGVSRVLSIGRGGGRPSARSSGPSPWLTPIVLRSASAALPASRSATRAGGRGRTCAAVDGLESSSRSLSCAGAVSRSTEPGSRQIPNQQRLGRNRNPAQT